MLIEMYGYFISEAVDEYIFEEILDPLLPLQGLPVPLPVRFAAYAVQLQYEAGQAIAAGAVESKYQYTGQGRYASTAQDLGYNLMYQPGGIKI
jgi:hypothetical protein